MFDANDISTRSYVRNIKCLQADSRITSTLSRHQINSKTECHSTLSSKNIDKIYSAWNRQNDKNIHPRPPWRSRNQTSIHNFFENRDIYCWRKFLWMTDVSCLRNTIVSSAQMRKGDNKKKGNTNKRQTSCTKREKLRERSEPKEPWKIRNIHA